jgi:hypothetical protein
MNVTMGSKRVSKCFMIEIFVPKRSKAALTMSGKYLQPLGVSKSELIMTRGNYEHAIHAKRSRP